MKNSLGKGLRYYLLYGFSYLIALFPLNVLYFFSDIFYIFLYYCIRYRRNMVRKNLLHSFPRKSMQDILKIEKDFYRFLCEYYVEAIKLLRISDKEISKRMKFENPELINTLTKNGNSCFLAIGHYGNWEWISSISIYLSRESIHGQIYKKLSNNAFNQLFLKIRSRFDAQSIEMKDTLRIISKTKQSGTPMVIGFITDQRPPRYYRDYWTTFLNQDTLVITGMERIAKQFGFAVLYLDIERKKRGYYVGNFSVITLDAAQTDNFDIMETYMRKLEKTITRNPAYWLWSHNRWKFSKKKQPKA